MCIRYNSLFTILWLIKLQSSIYSDCKVTFLFILFFSKLLGTSYMFCFHILQLTSTKPYLRKKAVLMMYKVFLKFPDALRPAFPRLKEKLEDPDSGKKLRIRGPFLKGLVTPNFALCILRCQKLTHFMTFLLLEKWKVQSFNWKKSFQKELVVYFWD